MTGSKKDAKRALLLTGSSRTRAWIPTTPTKITFFHPRQYGDQYNYEDKIRFERLEEQLRKCRTNIEPIRCNASQMETIKFGRSPECQIVLDDESMSKVYGELRVEKESNELKVFMYNLSKTKYIKVDGENVKHNDGYPDRAVLRPGSIVEFDPNKIKFQFEVQILMGDVGDTNFEFKTEIYYSKGLIEESQEMNQ